MPAKPCAILAHACIVLACVPNAAREHGRGSLSKMAEQKPQTLANSKQSLQAFFVGKTIASVTT
jgi:hypothetical protein